MKFGCSIVRPVHEVMKTAKLLEEHGFDYIWAVDECPRPPYRDPFIFMTLIGMATKNVKIGVGISPVYTRNPLLMAVAMHTLDELTGGRAVVGIGPGGTMPLAPLKIKMWDRPLRAVREWVDIWRRLFDGETVSYDGEFFKCEKARLFQIEEGRPPRKIPIYLAARGPMMLKLVGEIADGVLLTSPLEHFKYAMEKIREGATKAGKDISDMNIMNGVRFSVSEDREKAIEGVKPGLSFVISDMPDEMHKLGGITSQEAKALREAMRRGGPAEAKKFVTDEMVDTFAIAGTSEECLKKLLAYKDAGLTHLNTILSGDIDETLKILYEEIMPKIR